MISIVMASLHRTIVMIPNLWFWQYQRCWLRWNPPSIDCDDNFSWRPNQWCWLWWHCNCWRLQWFSKHNKHPRRCRLWWSLDRRGLRTPMQMWVQMQMTEIVMAWWLLKTVMMQTPIRWMIWIVMAWCCKWLWRFQPLVLDSANDADCDGVLTSLDCNDENPLAGNTTNDADCDGFEPPEDCNDQDATLIRMQLSF